MSFIAKNPLIMPEVETPSSTPPVGTRGLFAGKDGLYNIDSSGKINKLDIPADFKQDDETKADYIKNKPFNVGESGALLLNDAKDSEDIAIAVGGELVIAEDVSQKAGRWATDGIMIAVRPENKAMFDSLENVYVTYQGELKLLKKSNFYDWGNAGKFWGAEWAGQYAEYWLYWYNNADFDFMAEGLVQTKLDPIICKVNVFACRTACCVKGGEI